MKTKIIYISGNEVFNMNDIRAAFDEVRLALGLGVDTVLFGVPVDSEDVGFCKCETESKTEAISEPIVSETKDEEIEEIIPEPINEIINETEIPESQVIEDIVEPTPKKRGRPRKEIVTQIVEEVIEQEEPIAQEEPEINSEKIVPILSVLSADEEPGLEPEDIVQDINADVHEEIAQDIVEDVVEPAEESTEPDLEKLLSEMTPLQEDIDAEPIVEPVEEQAEDSVDATLEQLATEFAATQDKISSENKSSSRGKIGKLRNILPFKQSKHKDQGIGDLFGWAGTAANDEDFSVPGFFTNIASKK